MIIYIINYLLLIFFMFVYLRHNNKKNLKKVVFLISITNLVLIQGLRHPLLGKDMPIYWVYYSRQLSHSIFDLSFSDFELFFKLMTKIISSITRNKQVYLLVISILSNVPISMIIYKKSKNPLMSVLLFLSFGFYNFNFSGLRQAIAFALTFYSVTYIINKNFVKYIITIIFASLFHMSALVFLPAYFLNNFKITKFKIILLIVIYIIIYIFKIQIYNFINSIFYEEYGIVFSNSYLWMIMCLLILAICLISYKKICDDNKSILYNLVIIGSAIMLLSPIANNIMRIANYYYMFIILLIPEAISHIKNIKNRLLLNICTTVFATSLYVYLLLIDSYNIVPFIGAI